MSSDDEELYQYYDDDDDVTHEDDGDDGGYGDDEVLSSYTDRPSFKVTTSFDFDGKSLIYFFFPTFLSFKIMIF